MARKLIPIVTCLSNDSQQVTLGINARGEEICINNDWIKLFVAVTFAFFESEAPPPVLGFCGWFGAALNKSTSTWLTLRNLLIREEVQNPSFIDFSRRCPSL